MTQPEPAFFDVVRRQRACRAFTDQPVPDNLVERILQAATYAPSAENRQPWVFVVVRRASTRARLGTLMQRAWEGGGRAFAEQRLDARLLADVDAGTMGGVSAAPVLVVVAADTHRGLEATIPSSIFPATQNLLLSAQALGLGSALTTIATAFTDELREIVGLPAHVHPVAVVPIGWPARSLQPPRRESFSSRTFRESYGRPW